MSLSWQCRTRSTDGCRRASSMPASPSTEKWSRNVSWVRLLKLTWAAKQLPAFQLHGTCA